MQTETQPLRAGDVILFDAGDRSDVIHLVSHVLPNAIECVSRSAWSHSAMVFDLDAPVNGRDQAELHILESTILRGANGPQLNPLSARLADYTGGHAIACHLSERIRGFLDFGAMWRFAAGKLGRDRYNVAELLAYLARHIPIVQEIPALYQSDDDSEVCSEFVAQLLQAGGLPGLHPAVMAPEQLAQLRIYSGYSQLVGEPRLMPHFNSV